MVELKMRRFGLFSLVGAAISVGCLLGFISSANSPLEGFRYWFLLLYIVGTIGLFLVASYFLPVWCLFALGGVLAIASIFVEQMLVLGPYPGLAKDLSLFSEEHFRRLLLIIFGALCWYSLVACVVVLVRQMLRVGNGGQSETHSK